MISVVSVGFLDGKLFDFVDHSRRHSRLRRAGESSSSLAMSHGFESKEKVDESSSNFSMDFLRRC